LCCTAHPNISVLLVTRFNQKFSLARYHGPCTKNVFFSVSLRWHSVRELKVDVMRAYLLQCSPVRLVFTFRCPFCLRAMCTSQACKNGDTNAPLFFFLSHVLRHRFACNYTVKKERKSPFLFLFPPSLPSPSRSGAFIFVICLTYKVPFVSTRERPYVAKCN